MSAEESDHAAKVKRGMQLSRAHKAGEHTEPNPECAKCKKEAKGVKSPVPNVEAEVTLEGVPSITSTPTEPITGQVAMPNITITTEAPKKTPEQKEQEHIAAMEAAKEADQEALKPIAPVANKPGEVGGDKVGYDILVHVLKDGFTAVGAVWYRGQEIGIKRGSAVDRVVHGQERRPLVRPNPDRADGPVQGAVLRSRSMALRQGPGRRGRLHGRARIGRHRRGSPV